MTTGARASAPDLKGSRGRTLGAARRASIALVPTPPTEPPREPSTGPSRDDDTPQKIGDRDLGQWRTRLGRLLVWLAWTTAAAVARVIHWSLGRTALVITLVVGGTIAVVLTYAAGEVYEAVVEENGIARLDQPVLDAMVGMRSPGLDQALTWFTDLGSKVGMSIIAAVCTLALALWWRRRTPVILMLAASAGSLLMTVTGKRLSGTARPPQELAVPPFETSPSFPSGHTLNATVVVGILAYLLMLRLASRAARVAVGVAAVTFAFAMGLSRVYLGHHWLSDVVAAWLFGLGWLTVVVTAHRLMITLGRVNPVLPVSRMAPGAPESRSE